MILGGQKKKKIHYLAVLLSPLQKEAELVPILQSRKLRLVNVQANSERAS